MLDKHQKELNSLYGMSLSNRERKYYEDQKQRLYSKIGNEILDNFKKYQSKDFMEREKLFLRKNIMDFHFRSKKEYVKDETKKDIAKGLY